MRKFILISALFVLLQSDNSSADLITTLDFNDAATWSVTLSESNETVQNNSFVSGGTILADEGSSDGANAGVRISVDLIGSVSTVGFENITIAFQGLSGGGLEYDGDLVGSVGDSDGLRIVGSGVEINANSLSSINSTDAESDFESGAVFPNANFNSDFSFDSLVDDSSISDLTFVLQVNVGAETLQVSNVQIFGDSVTAVPEPSALLGLGSAFAMCGGLTAFRRRRRCVG
ncbi:PEP-CTERM sorting domain-containing protein [Rhodopirellula europaea]|uniref:PEP-CTERM sorting domain-containing protein n=1 Tax=Rhodopirellula europaea TaxID=1263866 RepID=UPI003D27D55B